MRLYVIVSGSIFGAIVVAHVARLVSEGWRPVTDPFFLVMTALSAALALWALAVLRRDPGPRGR